MDWQGVRTQIKIQFQDILALTVVIPFLTFTVLVLIGNRDLEVIRIYVPLISIILGGYFGQGAIKAWRTNGNYDAGEITVHKDNSPTI